MFSVAPNIVLAPNMTQNAERKHRTQDANTAHFQSCCNPERDHLYNFFRANQGKDNIKSIHDISMKSVWLDVIGTFWQETKGEFNCVPLCDLFTLLG